MLSQIDSMLKVKKFVVGYISNNCYLVYRDDQKEAFIVDPARGYDNIKRITTENGLTISAVFITHGHFDHIIDMAKWEQDGATLYIHTMDKDKLHSEKNLAPPRLHIESPIAEKTVNDGDIIMVGEIKVQVLHTPGHSKGSCCYLVDNLLFTGDTLFKCSCGRTDFYDGDDGEMLQSLNRLKNLKGDYIVYPGHEEESTLQYERKYNPYMQ